MSKENQPYTKGLPFFKWAVTDDRHLGSILTLHLIGFIFILATVKTLYLEIPFGYSLIITLCVNMIACLNWYRIYRIYKKCKKLETKFNGDS